MTADQAPELARFLAAPARPRLLRRRWPSCASPGSRFEYIARRVPATMATHVVDAAEDRGFKGSATRRDPVRSYPAGDVAANLVGFIGTDEPLGGFERTFDAPALRQGRPGDATRSAAATASRSGTTARSRRRSTARTCTLTIDRDLQWYTQRVLRQAVQDSGADSGFAVVMDSRTGELLALADYPTFDANKPGRVAEGRPRLARAERRLRAGLGREGAHAQRR